jgi:hypothetical protein
MSSEDYNHKTSKLKYKREMVLLATAVVALLILVVSKLPSSDKPEEKKPDLSAEFEGPSTPKESPDVLPSLTTNPPDTKTENPPPAASSQYIPPTEPIVLSEQYDTLELVLVSQLKAASLLIDGLEPEIFKRTPVTLNARFRHVTGSRTVQLRNSKFTCNTSVSFSGKKTLSMTTSNCTVN